MSLLIVTQFLYDDKVIAVWGGRYWPLTAAPNLIDCHFIRILIGQSNTMGGDFHPPSFPTLWILRDRICWRWAGQWFGGTVWRVLSYSIFSPLVDWIVLSCYGEALVPGWGDMLTLRRLMSYIYMEHPFLMFLDHTQRRSTVGRTPLDEW